MNSWQPGRLLLQLLRAAEAEAAQAAAGDVEEPAAEDVEAQAAVAEARMLRHLQQRPLQRLPPPCRRTPIPWTRTIPFPHVDEAGLAEEEARTLPL